MSNFLALADDFLERMNNPAYGGAVNDEYAMKFARLLRDEEFEAQLNQQIRDVNHADALRSHSWLWVIGWAKSKDVTVQEDVLVELFDRWGDVAAKASIIDLVLDRIEDEGLPSAQTQLEEFPVRFLARIMRRAVEIPEPPRGDRVRDGEPSELLREPEEAQPSMAKAEGLLVALLQVGNPMALAAASVLLRHAWRGHGQLSDFYSRLLDRLEPETRAEWERSIFRGRA